MTEESQILNLNARGMGFLWVCPIEGILLSTLYLFFSSQDPFANDGGQIDSTGKVEVNIGSGIIHIRIQQRNGRKTLTTVQGIADEFDKKKLVRAFKKEFACNGTVVDHSEYGEVIQLQGDQRNNVCLFLTKIGIAKEEQLKVHGF
jgi:translation initiation factor 1